MGGGMWVEGVSGVGFDGKGGATAGVGWHCYGRGAYVPVHVSEPSCAVGGGEVEVHPGHGGVDEAPQEGEGVDVVGLCGLPALRRDTGERGRCMYGESETWTGLHVCVCCRGLNNGRGEVGLGAREAQRRDVCEGVRQGRVEVGLGAPGGRRRRRSSGPRRSRRRKGTATPANAPPMTEEATTAKRTSDRKQSSVRHRAPAAWWTRDRPSLPLPRT